MRGRTGIAITALILVVPLFGAPACDSGGDTSTCGIAGSHSHPGADGLCYCDEGYDWADPDDPGNNSCGLVDGGDADVVSEPDSPGACVPDCADRECGDDGCGGLCGSCPAGQQCVGGGACVPDACQPRCAGRQCGDDGCGGSCGACSGGALCDAAGACVTSQFGSVRGSLQFEARVASQNADGQIALDQVQTFPATGALAVAFDGAQQTIGQGYVDDTGAFNLPLSGPLDANSMVVFAALATTSDNQGALLAVVQPQAGGEPTLGNSLDVWTWNAAIPANGVVGDLVITEAQGSGALFVYLFTLSAMGQVLVDVLNGAEADLRSLAVLWSPGVAWSCGACYASSAWQTLNGLNQQLEQSIFIGGEADGSSVWGWPVILHEFGHYTARNYSKDDSPGGPHSVGQPVVPPFAWSEGWASFFAVSTMSRWIGEPVSTFWDIQQGASFWIDYHAAKYSNDSGIVPPDPQLGMDQLLDENWVGTMLWDLWDGADVPDVEGADNDGTALGTVSVLKAFGALGGASSDRGAPGVDFVDFVDRAICQQPALGQSIANTVVSYEGFPYDGNAPCN